MDKEYEIAKYFAKNGLSIGSRQGITKHKTDYVYDEDPSHPESYKKGDIKIYDLYVINREESGIYELHSFSDYLRWLINYRSLCIQFNVLRDVESNIYWTFSLYNTKTAELLKTVYKHCTDYNDALEKAVLYIVNNKILEKYNL